MRISKMTDQAGPQLKETATNMKTALLDWSTEILKTVHRAREAEDRMMNGALARMGLQRRRSRLHPAMWFMAGVAAAGAVIVLTTPAGKQLRKQVSELLRAGGSEASRRAESMDERVQARLRDEIGGVTAARASAASATSAAGAKFPNGA